MANAAEERGGHRDGSWAGSNSRAARCCRSCGSYLRCRSWPDMRAVCSSLRYATLCETGRRRWQGTWSGQDKTTLAKNGERDREPWDVDATARKLRCAHPSFRCARYGARSNPRLSELTRWREQRTMMHASLWCVLPPWCLELGPEVWLTSKRPFFVWAPVGFLKGGGPCDDCEHGRPRACSDRDKLGGHRPGLVAAASPVCQPCAAADPCHDRAAQVRFRNEGPTGDGSPWTDPRFVGAPFFIVRQTSADCLLVRIHLYTSLLARLVATINGQPSEALDAAICGALMHHLAGGLALVPWVAALIVGLVARHALSWSGALRLLLLPLLESAFSAAVCNHLRTRSSFFSARAGP